MLCECGCGKVTSIAMKDRDDRGLKKGDHHRFIQGHNHRGANAHNWNGGRIKMGIGYIGVRSIGHPRARNGYVLEHVLLAEKALDRPIPDKVEVHHVNGIKSDNRNENLVICDSVAYHKLLHKRTAAYKATGNPEALYCTECKQYDMSLTPKDKYGRTWHPECSNAAQKIRRDKRNAERRKADRNN